MQVIHLGGADCVIGSCHLLQANDLNIMVDCGAIQGNDRAVPMKRWPVRPCDIDYLFLTHAHVDHIGRVPELIDKGFRGEIICTHPTREILFPMLEDAMGFSDRNPSQIEKIKVSLDDFAWGFEYGRSFDLKAGIRFKLGNAGHILGSCFVRFESSDPPWSVVFSGDLGPPDTPILPDPDIPDPCDLLILESTYGDRLHEDRRARAGRLGQILSKALSDNGKVFVPVFALGRCQELIYEMDRIFGGWGQTGKIPVFVDSPLGLEITKIYSRLSEYWDRDAKELLNRGDHPIDFKTLYAVENHQSHVRLTDIPGPAVILAGSGMCTGGRIVDHLVKGLEERRNDLLFVGYQAQGTPGRNIVRFSNEQGGYVRLQGEKIDIKARVHELTGYSAHADQKDLVNWVNAMEARPKEIRLVHGESAARRALFKRLGF